MDLLAYTSPVAAFEPSRVRGATLAATLAKAISAALKACGKSRDQVAHDLGEYLGDPLEKSTLDKWASEANEGYLPTIVRFIGLIHATKSRALLQVIADHFGWAVIDKKYLPAIEYAALSARKEELDRHLSAMKRDLRGSGVLE
jgi:hypothetical protein